MKKMLLIAILSCLICTAYAEDGAKDFGQLTCFSMGSHHPKPTLKVHFLSDPRLGNVITGTDYSEYVDGAGSVIRQGSAFDCDNAPTGQCAESSSGLLEVTYSMAFVGTHSIYLVDLTISGTPQHPYELPADATIMGTAVPINPTTGFQLYWSEEILNCRMELSN